MMSLSRPASAEAALCSPSSRRGLQLPPRTPRTSSIKSSNRYRTCATQPNHSTPRAEVRSQALYKSQDNLADRLNNTSRQAVYQSQDNFADRYDTNFWHYQPWWWQPHSIIMAGSSIIALCSLLAEDHLKAALYTSIPVLAWSYVFLRVLPCQFRSSAVHYLETHDLEDL